MYHPYFRGKQYELITIRETSALIAGAQFVPIIEPVKQALSGLQKTLESLCATGGQAVVIVNPYHGPHAEDGDNITELLRQKYQEAGNISAGVLLREDTTTDEALACCALHSDHPLTLIHAGFTDPKALIDGLRQRILQMKQVFFEPMCGKLYRRNFGDCPRVLLRDGFERRNNREYPALELFSDLHVTYQEEGMQGFGDFLIVGDEFSESGGPAYAVAIHLTFIDGDEDDAMFVHHFKSTRNDTPTDPAGKFQEALDSMLRTLNSPKSKVLETDAVKEFRELHKRKHFPGLGYVKKLSMNHHVQTLDEFIRRG